MLGERPVRTWSSARARPSRGGGGLRTSLGVGPATAVALFAVELPRVPRGPLLDLARGGGRSADQQPRCIRARPRSSSRRARARSVCFARPRHRGRTSPEHLPGQVPRDRPRRARTTSRCCEPSRLRPCARALDDDAWIFFTSGTTGRAKGARLTHGNLLAMTAAYYADVRRRSRPRDSILHIASLSHASGLFSLALPRPRARRRCCRRPAASTPAELLELVAARRALAPSSSRRRCCAACASTPHGARRRSERIGTVIVRRRAGAARAICARASPRSGRGSGTATARARRRARSPRWAPARSPTRWRPGDEERLRLRGRGALRACACGSSTTTTASCRPARSARSWWTGRP